MKSLAPYTIANGQVPDGGPLDRRGAAINCIQNSSPTIRDCRFVDNDAYAKAFGGGIAATSSAPEITACEFLSNDGEGGGAIACFDASVRITDCHFEDNRSDNRGGGAIGCYEGSDVTVVRSTFLANRGSGAAIFANNGAHVTLSNCTLVAGESSDYGSGVYIGNFGFPGPPPATASLDHTIIAFGVGAEAITCTDGGTALLTCCDLYGNEGGDWQGCVADQLGVAGNINLDPLFCGPDLEDLTIQAGSPCAPGNSMGCGLIGAAPVGCDATVLRPRTWGAIKSSFR